MSWSVTRREAPIEKVSVHGPIDGDPGLIAGPAVSARSSVCFDFMVPGVEPSGFLASTEDVRPFAEHLLVMCDEVERRWKHR